MYSVEATFAGTGCVGVTGAVGIGAVCVGSVGVGAVGVRAVGAGAVGAGAVSISCLMESTGAGCPAEDCDLSKSVRHDSTDNSRLSKLFMADDKASSFWSISR